MCENKIVKWWMVPLAIFMKHLDGITGALWATAATALGILIYTRSRTIPGVYPEISDFGAWFDAFLSSLAFLSLFFAILCTGLWFEIKRGSW